MTKSKSKTFPNGTEILIDAIEASDSIDPATKLLALVEIDRLQKGELKDANYAGFTSTGKVMSPSIIVSGLFIWHRTENGHEFWRHIEQQLQGGK